MKKFLLILPLFLLVFLYACSTPDDKPVQGTCLNLDLETVLLKVQNGVEVADVAAVERDGATLGYIVLFEDGSCMNLYGQAEGSAVTGLSEDSVNYYLEMGDGSRTVLPKKLDFGVVFQCDDTLLTDGGTVAVRYKVTGAAGSLDVSVMAGEGWSVDKCSSSETEGIITVTAPDPITSDKVLVCVKDGSGRQIVRALNLTIKSSVQRGNIPLFAYVGVRYYTVDPEKVPYSVALRRYQAVKEGGIQIIPCGQFDGWDLDEVKFQLDLAEKVGVKMAVYVEHHGGDGLREYVRQIKDHPALWGYQLFDEPNADDFKHRYATQSIVREIDTNPEHLCLLNVGGEGGTYGPYGVYRANSYDEYLERLVNEAHPDFLSFDYYPCMNDSVLEKDWFATIQQVADKAQKYGLDFWAYAATCRFTDGLGTRCKPSIASLRLQDYTNLAYGAQGLEYFTWAAAGDNMSDWVCDLEGDISTTNPTFDCLKFVNEEVQKRAFVFDGCTVKWVALYKDAPAGIREVDESMIPEEIESVTSDRGLTMSLIENDGGRSEYFNIVSRTHLRTTPVHLRLRYPVQIVERDGSLKSLNPGDYDITLDPGDILIIKTK